MGSKDLGRNAAGNRYDDLEESGRGNFKKSAENIRTKISECVSSLAT